MILPLLFTLERDLYLKKTKDLSVKQKQYINEMLKRASGNKVTCDQCKKTQTTLHHVIVDHDDSTVTVFCNECFLKKAAQDVRKIN